MSRRVIRACGPSSRQPRNRPLEHMVRVRIARVRPEQAVSPDLLPQPRPHFAPRARLRKERLPHLRPALGRVAVHARPRGGAPEALLRAPAVDAEDHRARARVEQAHEQPRDGRLALEVEEVEEGAEERRRHAPVQLAERPDRGERWRRRGGRR